jgi:hypothetical protein
MTRLDNKHEVYDLSKKKNQDVLCKHWLFQHRFYYKTDARNRSQHILVLHCISVESSQFHVDWKIYHTLQRFDFLFFLLNIVLQLVEKHEIFGVDANQCLPLYHQASKLHGACIQGSFARLTTRAADHLKQNEHRDQLSVEVV